MPMKMGNNLNQTHEIYLDKYQIIFLIFLFFKFFFYSLFNVDLQYLQYWKRSNSNINQIYTLIQIDVEKRAEKRVQCSWGK